MWSLSFLPLQIICGCEREERLPMPSTSIPSDVYTPSDADPSDSITDSAPREPELKDSTPIGHKS
jgi:hypothetical protein